MKKIPNIWFLGVLLLFATTITGVGHAASSSILILPSLTSPDPVAIKYTNIVDSGTIVTKPTCAAGLEAKVFVTPAIFLGGTTTNLMGIAGVSAYAVDNGTTWTITGQIKDVSSTTWSTGNSLKILVIARCCATGTNCE